MRHLLDRIPGPPARTPPGRGLEPRRRWVVHAVVVAILAGSLYSVKSGKELWPFSPYPMYSGIQGPELVWVGIYGVTAEGAEVPLRAREHFPPFKDVRLMRALGRARVLKGQEALREGTAWMGRVYRDGAGEGRHDDPPLERLRVYRVTWTLRPDAGNVGRPDRRELLVDMELPDPSGTGSPEADPLQPGGSP